MSSQNLSIEHSGLHRIEELSLRHGKVLGEDTPLLSNREHQPCEMSVKPLSAWEKFRTPSRTIRSPIASSPHDYLKPLMK